MQNTIHLSHWFKVIDTEYLSSFIADGGSSIKFAVTPENLNSPLYEMVDTRGRELDYLVLRLDAKTMRAHMPQDFFFALARQVDWRELARRVVLRIASENGYGVEGVGPESPGVYEAIATANNVSPRMVHIELKPALQQEVFSNSNMAKDFRVCMSHLCWKEFVPFEYTGQPLLDWLTGENTKISGVRPFSIAGGINRTTARYFIESSLYWIRHAGYAGTVILLDSRRVTVSRNPRDDHRYYTRAMTLEHYELLREFIDGVDRLTNTLMVVVTSDAFLDTSPERRSRGYGIYPALQTRVMDDVRDLNRANPVASLVALS